MGQPMNVTPPDRRREILAMVGVFLTLLAALLGWLTRPGSLDQGALALINGQAITPAQFQAELKLTALKDDLVHRERAVNEPALFNRMIADALILQAAGNDGVRASPNQVAAEIQRILARYDLTRPDMERLLVEHELVWQEFERSVADYVTLNLYVEETVLAGATGAQPSAFLQQWLDARYQAADMRFDPDFLATINPPATDPLFPGWHRVAAPD